MFDEDEVLFTFLGGTYVGLAMLSLKLEEAHRSIYVASAFKGICLS